MNLRDELMRVEDPAADCHTTESEMRELRAAIAQTQGGADWLAWWDAELAAAEADIEATEAEAWL